MHEQLRLALINLDAALTGNTDRRTHHTASDSNVNSFVEGHEYYLSDGGYSRVIMNDLSMKLRLTSNSRNEVKQTWSKHEQLVQEVEQLYGLAQRS